MIEQRSPEWHKARSGRLTGSQFAAAIGVSPYCSRQRLYRILTGREAPAPTNPAMQYGIDHESIAIDRYECETGLIVKPSGFIEHGDYLGVSPDGLVANDGAIEVKCPASGLAHEGIPNHYLPQCVGVLHICQREWIDFVSWSPEKMNVVRITREDSAALWKAMEAELIEFYEKYILADVEPPRQRKKNVATV